MFSRSFKEKTLYIWLQSEKDGQNQVHRLSRPLQGRGHATSTTRPRPRHFEAKATKICPRGVTRTVLEDPIPEFMPYRRAWYSNITIPRACSAV